MLPANADASSCGVAESAEGDLHHRPAPSVPLPAVPDLLAALLQLARCGVLSIAATSAIFAVYSTFSPSGRRRIARTDWAAPRAANVLLP
jgi:hypothetical protein